MESKEWSFLKSQKILSTAGIVEVLKITREPKNPVKITFLFSLLSYLFSVKYTILLIFYCIIRTYKIWVTSFLACPLVQRKFFSGKSLIFVFALNNPFISHCWLVLLTPGSRATSGRRNCRRIKYAPRQISLEIPLDSAGLEMQHTGWWGN